MTRTFPPTQCGLIVIQVVPSGLPKSPWRTRCERHGERHPSLRVGRVSERTQVTERLDVLHVSHVF